MERTEIYETLQDSRPGEELWQKIGDFLLKNKDELLLAGQLGLVALICLVGIRNDLVPPQCCKKKRKKKRR